MATITTKVCDRCKAQHVIENYSDRPVQEIRWFVSSSPNLHTTQEVKKELCLPCRQALSEMIWKFVKG